MVALREELNNEIEEFKTLLESYENHIEELKKYKKYLDDVIDLPGLRSRIVSKIATQFKDINKIIANMEVILLDLQDTKYIGTVTADDITIIEVLGDKFKLLSISNYNISKEMIDIYNDAVNL